MAGKGKLKGLSRAQRKELWETPGVEGWWNWLNEIAPAGAWRRTAQSVKGRCVIAQKKGGVHADSNPSMELVPGKGLVWCFPCGDGEYDPLEFIQLVRSDWTKEEAYHAITGRFNIKQGAEIQEQLLFEAKINELKRQIVIACRNALHAAVNDSSIEYAQRAVAYLRKRGVDLGNLWHYNIGVWPTRRELWGAIDNEHVTFIDEWLPHVFNKDISPDAVDRYGGRVVLPYYHTPRVVGRIKLRDPELDKDKRKPDAWIGNEDASEQGFFGLNAYPAPMGHDSNKDSRRVFIVEGEFDQLSFEHAQFKHDNASPWPLVAGSGGAVADIERITDAGYREVCVIPDNDAGGDSFVKNILRGMSTQQERLRRLRIFTWPKSYAPGADPDDVVQAGRYSEFRRDILDMDNYEEPHQWCVRNAVAAVQGLDEAPTIKEKMRIAQEFGELIKDPLERDVFIETAAPALEIKPTLLDKHVTDINDGGRFITAIARALGRQMTPLQFVSGTLTCYNRQTKDTFDVKMTPKRDMFLTLTNNLFQGSEFDWVRANVGVPNFIAEVRNTRGVFPRPHEKQIDQVQRFVDEAMKTHAGAAAAVGNTWTVGQGMHLITKENDYAELGLVQGEDALRSYLVNGLHLFLGRRDPETAINVAEEVDSPLHGAMLLDGARGKQWSEVAVSADALNAVPDLSLKETYEQIVELLGFWNYYDPDIHIPFLAAHVMLAPVMSIFPQMAFVFLTATTQSGKSTMLLGLFNNKKHPRITLVENSIGFDAWTEAGIMQSVTGTSQLACVDEFEDPDHSASADKATQAAKLLETIRNMESGMVRIRGTRWQRAIERAVKVPFMAAGIHPFQKAEDINRWVTVGFDKTTGKTAPDTAIIQKHGLDYVKRLRRCVTLHAFQNMFRWREAYDEMQPRILNKDLFEYRASRTARMLIPHMMLLEQAGVDDWVEWGQKMLTETEEVHTASSQETEDVLFRAVFHTNGVPLEHLKHRQSVVYTLSNQECASDMSRANVGVYWQEGSEVIVLWPEKLPELLKFNAAFKHTKSVSQLYTLLKRHPKVHSDPKYFMNHPEILHFMRRYAHAPDARELLYVFRKDLHFTKGEGDPPTDM